MQMKKLPDVEDFISISTKELEEAVDFSHALVELKISHDYHAINDKYMFIVTEEAFTQIMEGAVAGMLEELIPNDQEQAED